MGALAIEKKRRNMMRLALLAGFALALSCRYYVGVVNCLNTTVYAFSYKYGYISRGFMGTVIRIINLITGKNLLTYQGIVFFSGFLNTVYLVILFVFFWMILSAAEKKYETKLLALMFVFGIFAFPEYITEENFGRSDICLVMITLIGCFLILKRKWEWLIIPLVAMAVSIHQGYVLMFFNVLLVLLFVRMFDVDEAGRKKYILIFAASLLVGAVLFLYLNFFSHHNGREIYDEIYANAGSYAHDGVVQENVILHEILGESPAVDEWDEHIHNFCEFPVFLLLISPYLVIATRFFKRVLLESKGIERLKYLAITFGWVTILPDLIVKIDYGRWVFSIIFYFFITIMALLAMGDSIICRQLEKSAAEVRRKPLLVMFLLAYPILFTPLEDVNICDFSRIIVDHFIPSIY